jgi:hypothetical protein
LQKEDEEMRLRGFALMLLLVGCPGPESTGTEPTGPEVQNISGDYFFFGKIFYDTCDPAGPSGGFVRYIPGALDQDAFGQAAFVSGGIYFGLEIEPGEKEYKLKLVSDCVLLDKNDELSGKTCAEDGAKFSFDGIFGLDDQRIKATMVFDYLNGCGADEKQPGLKKIFINGNLDPFAEECKPTSFYCYTEVGCRGKLPRCELDYGRCDSKYSKSYRIVGENACRDL